MSKYQVIWVVEVDSGSRRGWVSIKGHFNKYEARKMLDEIKYNNRNAFGSNKYRLKKYISA